MKKLIIILASIVSIIAISCAKKVAPVKTNETVTVPPKATVTYASNIKTLIQTKCTPCHIPANGGFKTSFDNYDAAKKYIDDMIRRIQLNPTDKDYMPFKFPKLSAEDVAVFKKWKEEGMVE
jgi:uncharacterized membrane protein